MADSKLMTALASLRAYVRDASRAEEGRPAARSPWGGFARQYPDLHRAVTAVVAAAPGDDLHLGHYTLAELFAPTGGVSWPYLALAFELKQREGGILEPCIVAFARLERPEGPTLETFIAQHKSPEHQRTVMVCAIAGGY
jgi:hypothetical protein